MQPYIYKLRNKLTGQYYIGVQYGKKSNPSNLWKTYFSSSKYVLENKENFEVVYTKPREDAREYESKLLNRIFRIFGKEKFLQIMVNRNIAPGILHDEEEKSRIAKRLKYRWENGLMDEAHEKGSKTRKTRVYEKYVMPLEKRKSYSERMTSNNPMYDSTIKERHKEKMNSPEIKRKRAEISKGNTYVKGKSWYNNGIECKMLHEAPEGWAKGRLNPHWNHNRKNNA